MNKAKSISIVLRVTVAVALIAYLFSRVNVAVVYERALDSNLYLLSTGTLILALQPALGSARWNIILTALKHPVSLGKTLRWTYIGVFFGQALPATIGADAIRVWLAGRDEVGWHDSVVSVLLDRVVMLLLLAVLLLSGLPYIAKMSAAPWISWLVLMFLLCGVAGLALLLFGNRILKSLDRHRFVRAFSHLSQGTRRLVLHPVALLLTVVLCGLSYLDLMASVFFYVRAFGASTDLMQIVFLLPPVLFASMLPVSLGGWGTREVAMVTALGLVGIPADAALLASLWLGISSILIALPGAVLFMARRVDLKANEIDILPKQQGR